MGLTPEGVVQAAGDLVDEQGLSALRLATLAQRLGVRSASLYAHVGGLDDLRQRLSASSLEMLAGRLAPAVAGRAGAEAIEAFARAHRDFAREHPGRYEATRLRVAPGSDAAIGAGRRLADLSRAVLRAYALDGDAEVHAVRLLGSTVHGFVELEGAGSFDHSAPEPGQSWPVVVAWLDVALRSGVRP